MLARTYAAQFSEAELKELIAFYGTPVGKKLVERRQVILDGGMRGVQTWSAKLAREIETKVREEMKKRGYTIRRVSRFTQRPGTLCRAFCVLGVARVSILRGPALPGTPQLAIGQLLG